MNSFSKSVPQQPRAVNSFRLFLLDLFSSFFCILIAFLYLNPQSLFVGLQFPIFQVNGLTIGKICIKILNVDFFLFIHFYFVQNVLFFISFLLKLTVHVCKLILKLHQYNSKVWRLLVYIIYLDQTQNKKNHLRQVSQFMLKQLQQAYECLIHFLI